YKGLNYSARHLKTTLNTDNVDLTASPLDPDTLNIKIIGFALFTCILQDGTPAFQLQITLTLPEEHLDADTTTSGLKTKEQILCKVVPPKYHEFADMFSKGSAKELPPHWSYDHKMDLKDDTAPSFGKIYSTPLH
ncbi:hypothetical protein C0993_005799, partial [Termitomyces sp. T159_Od127]